MYTIILIIHVAIGTIALLSGAVAIFAKKGGKLHMRSGTVYYYCMYGVGISAFVMTIMKFNPFLMVIAIFSLYATYSGKKAIDYWRLKADYTPTLKDKLHIYIAFPTSLFMIGFPVVQMIARGAFSVPILSVFGVILLAGAIRDMRKYANPDNFKPRNKQWLIDHIGSMGGAYIATFTAFLVNNVRMDPAWVPWLAPTAVGVTLIVAASIKWRKKLKIGF